MTEEVSSDRLERLESLKGLIPEAKLRKKLGTVSSSAIRAVTEAKESILRLEELSEFTPLISDFVDPSDRSQLHLLLSSIKEIGNKLSHASDSDALSHVAQSVSHRLIPNIEQSGEFIRRGWKAKIDKTFYSIGHLGEILQQIPETQQLGRNMGSLLNRAEQLKVSVTDAEQCAEDFKTLEMELEQSSVNLSSIGAGDEVVEFLLAVAEQSATLANVTQEVSLWIEERHSLGRFKVVL